MWWDMEMIGALLRPIGNWIIGSFPGWVLRTLYTPTKLIERVIFIAEGVGPHLYVTPGTRLAMDGIRLVILNRLPFRIELAALRLEIALESTILTEVAKNDRLVVSACDIARLSISHGLTDN